MDATLEKRVNELGENMVEIGNHIDKIVNWLADHMNKANDGNSFGDWMTGALFGGGLIGMAISKKIRTGKKSTKVIYDGMTADDMGQDIINSVRKMVNYQAEIQSLVDKNVDNEYYNLVKFIIQYAVKYHKGWMYFNSYYVLNHKVDYEGNKITLEEMVRKQWIREIQRLDMLEEDRKGLS
jgi:hypothetical protein